MIDNLNKVKYSVFSSNVRLLPILQFLAKMKNPPYLSIFVFEIKPYCSY